MSLIFEGQKYIQSAKGKSAYENSFKNCEQKNIKKGKKSNNDTTTPSIC